MDVATVLGMAIAHRKVDNIVGCLWGAVDKPTLMRLFSDTRSPRQYMESTFLKKLKMLGTYFFQGNNCWHPLLHATTFWLYWGQEAGKPTAFQWPALSWMLCNSIPEGTRSCNILAWGCFPSGQELYAKGAHWIPSGNIELCAKEIHQDCNSLPFNQRCQWWDMVCEAYREQSQESWFTGSLTRKLFHWKPTSTNLCQLLWGSEVKWNILITLINY